VPILIKDNIDTKDLPSSAGTPALERDYPRANAPVVERLLNAGALVAGKANLYELAVGGTSLNLHFGRVANPWRLNCIAGGSSGPCSLSGIAGFRPSFQRYPGSGVMPVTPTRDSVGIMANSVTDLALLDAAAGAQTFQLTDIDLAGVRLGRPRDDFYAVMDDRTARVIDAAIALLEEHGAIIIDADLPGLAELTAKAAWTISAYEVPRDISAYLEQRGTSLTIDEIVSKIASPVVRERFNPSAVDLKKLEAPYRKAMEVYRPQLQKMLKDYFTEHRVSAIVFPTTPFPAPEIDDDNADLVINGKLIKGGFARVINNTVHQSAAGIPSLVVPAGLTDDGLPVGLSFDGLDGSDRQLLAIGKAFEEIRGPFPLPPLG
jgi:mandelamide amidase